MPIKADNQDYKKIYPPINFQIQERAKCAADPAYYLNTYGFVFDAKLKKIAKMNCFEYQENCLNDFEKFRNNIVLKSRQTGLSVVSAGYAAWKLLFRYDERILVIANTGDGAIRFVNTVRTFLDYTPQWLQPKSRITNNQKKIEFSNNCWIEAKASSPQAGRGDSLSLLILDETAFIEDMESIWAAASIALAVTRGKCLMISTPNGLNNLYHQKWISAENKDDVGMDDRFNPVKVHWTQNPIAAEGLQWREDHNGNKYPWSPWYEEVCKTLKYDPVLINQELNLSFEGSKRLAFDYELIDYYKKNIQSKKIEPIRYFKYDFMYKGEEKAGSFVSTETPFWIWKLPEKDHKYIVSCDVASGKGEDYSTIQIIDSETLEQVAEYKEKIAIDLFPYIVDCVARLYHNAYLCVEQNNHGWGVVFPLRDKFQYKNLHYSRSDRDVYLPQFDYKIDANINYPGIYTSKRTKVMYMKCLSEHMREKTLEINSNRIMNEFETFIANGDSFEAERGYHDDLIMALAIALFIRDTEFEQIAKSKEIRKTMMDAISVSTNALPDAAKSYGGTGNMPPIIGKADPKKEKPKEIEGNSIFFGNIGKEVDPNDEPFQSNDWLLA